MKFSLLSNGKANNKIGKNKNENYLIFSLNLKPSSTEINGKKYNLCPFETEGCKNACVGTNGHFSMKNGSAYKAQVRRTKAYFTNTKAFYNVLNEEIQKGKKQAKRKDSKAVFRLNAYSDINHSKQSKRYLSECIMESNKDAIFYDYTKDVKKALNNKVDNYFLTYSHNENVTLDYSLSLLNKTNVAIVFEEIPKTFRGFPVFNGDKDDNRFLDPKGHIIALKFKGSSKKKLEAISKGFCIPKSMN